MNHAIHWSVRSHKNDPKQKIFNTAGYKGRPKSIFFANVLTLSQKNWYFYVSAVKYFENTVDKGEIAHNRQFSFSHGVFSSSEKFLSFSSNLNLSSANSFSLEERKICCLGKSYNPFSQNCSKRCFRL